MNITTILFRYRCILKRLQKGPATRQQIADYILMQCEIYGYEFSFSQRQFLRDKESILSVMGIEIFYTSAGERYYIDKDDLNLIPPPGHHLLALTL